MTIAIPASKADWASFFNPDDASPRTSRAAAFPRAQHKPLGRSLTGGRFSVIGNGTVTIAAVPGLAVQARSGMLWITQEGDQDDHLVAAGERFVADRYGTLVISAFERSEVELEWPSHEHDRLSPGLERDAVAA
jgi:hypothetical protein